MRCLLALLFASSAAAAAFAGDTAEDLERKAMRRDYQAQRNLAYSYQVADLGLPKDFMKACMWRTVIILSGDKQVDRSDASNVDYACGKLSPAERTAAVSQGEALAKKLYKR
jgi:hypothetical protein